MHSLPSFSPFPSREGFEPSVKNQKSATSQKVSSSGNANGATQNVDFLLRRCVTFEGKKEQSRPFVPSRGSMRRVPFDPGVFNETFSKTRSQRTLGESNRTSWGTRSRRERRAPDKQHTTLFPIQNPKPFSFYLGNSEATLGPPLSPVRRFLFPPPKSVSRGEKKSASLDRSPSSAFHLLSPHLLTFCPPSTVAPGGNRRRVRHRHPPTSSREAPEEPLFRRLFQFFFFRGNLGGTPPTYPGSEKTAENPSSLPLPRTRDRRADPPRARRRQNRCLGEK